MSEFNKEEILEKMESLPPNLQKALASAWVSDLLAYVGIRAGLRIDKIGTLVEETGYHIMGLKPIAEYAQNIESKLKLSKEQAEKIAKEVDEKLFEKLRTSLGAVRAEGRGRYDFSDVAEEEGAADAPAGPPGSVSGSASEQIARIAKEAQQEKERLSSSSGPAPSPERDLVSQKMLGPTVEQEEAVDELPEGEEEGEKKDYGGRDPYRELPE